MKLAGIIGAALTVMSLQTEAAEPPILIVAAQNYYGEIASAIGGDRVSVESILVSPDADPHSFEPSPAIAHSVADADIVVLNGAGYDYWMEDLLNSLELADLAVIEAATLVESEGRENPHVWYDPQTMPAVAEMLTRTLAAMDPDGADEYEFRRKSYVATLTPISDKIREIRQRFKGTTITATEPVFGYMGDALGLKMSNQDFQIAIMNETEPSVREIAGIIDDLTNREAKVLIYNAQIGDAMTAQLLAIAKNSNVPVVGVTETMPNGKSYGEWMLDQLERVEKALSGPSS